MDEQRLFRRLTRIYSVTAAAVLLAVFFFVGVLLHWDTRSKNRAAFSALLTALTDRLQTDSYVSHSRLRELEQRNLLLLCIDDNGGTLLYNTGDSDEKKAVFSKAEALAREDGYDKASLPLTTERRTSPVYSFRAGGVSYLGAVSILPLSGKYRTVTMAQRVLPLSPWKTVTLAAGYLLSALLLCAAGNRLIRRALLPAMESRRRQTAFIAAASHELRSPLTVISINAATIQTNPDGAGAAAAVIGRESARMSRLLSDLLLLASTDAKGWPVSLSPVEADTLLLNVYETYAPVFLERSCALSLLLPEDALPKVSADPERLSQVLGILLDNALSYGVTKDRAAVELGASVSGKGVCLTVTDHGPGLTGEQKKLVFERFYRGDAARRDKQHFGLGLSIAYELVRLQNGRLTLEDTPGDGCTFRILLP